MHDVNCHNFISRDNYPFYLPISLLYVGGCDPIGRFCSVLVGNCCGICSGFIGICL